ncbi:hypothetical protein H8D83_01505 [Candidatus Woesearchaeota archaeon]|nr:hypothetical protein [Candidatus Woesearchaeota archaeon]MBL7050857.1 hypothetical protein [Candidatus Woesearchaeota archaeon]
MANEIPDFAFWFIGLVVALASAFINFWKFFLFFLIGIGFILYGIVKRVRKR